MNFIQRGIPYLGEKLYHICEFMRDAGVNALGENVYVREYRRYLLYA